MMQEKEASLVQWELGSVEPKRLFRHVQEDDLLSDALEMILQNMEGAEDIEVFEKRHNIAATSAGYFGVFWKEYFEGQHPEKQRPLTIGK